VPCARFDGQSSSFGRRKNGVSKGVSEHSDAYPFGFFLGEPFFLKEKEWWKSAKLHK
jgi:hypothetical protein